MSVTRCRPSHSQVTQILRYFDGQIFGYLDTSILDGTNRACLCGVKEIINLKFHRRTPKRHIESSLSPKLRALYQKQMRKTHDNISDTFAVCNAIVNCVRRQPKSDAMRIARSIDGEYHIWISRFICATCRLWTSRRPLTQISHLRPFRKPKIYPLPSSKSIANIFGYQTRASTESNWALMGPVAMIKAITPGGKNCFHIWTQQWVSIFVINKFEIIINVTGNLDTKLHHLIFNQSEFRAAWKSTKLPHDWIAFMNLLNIISFSGPKRYILNIYNSIFHI